MLLGICMAISLCTYQNYGASWDEDIQRTIGLTSYKYVFEGDNALDSYIERDHGVGFELPLVMIEKTLHLEDMRDILLMRHLVSNLFFMVCMYCGYVLALRLFRNQWLALLCFLVLVFHPRIYPHSFFNTKDVPFLGAIMIVLMLAESAFRKQKWHLHLLLGIACGYATSIRILGITPVAILGMFYIIDFIGNKETRKATATHLLLLGAGFCVAVYACWPMLWHEPLHNFAEAYESLSKFRWENPVLLNGESVLSTQLPWYYIPEWFGITMPEIWLAAGVITMTITIAAFARRPKSFLIKTKQRNFLLYGMLIFIPVLSVILLHSVVYDDWRHLYFIYPAFVMFVIAGVQQTLNGKSWMRLATIALMSLQLADVAFFTIRNHPNSQTYFNRLVWHGNEYLRYRFELDYWGCTFKKGYEEILARDSSYNIKVAGFWMVGPYTNNYDLLPATDRVRITLTGNTDEANYYMTNFRGHKEDYFQFGPVFYELKVQGSTIMRIYKIR
jgi:hypothetical protein